MSKLIPKLMLLAAIGASAAACENTGNAAQPGPYGNPVYNNGYYAPPPPVYGRPAPGYYYPNQPMNQGVYNRTDGRRYTTVTVTNRGQNGYRDDVVQQQVVCGSQYFDGYRTQTAPSC